MAKESATPLQELRRKKGNKTLAEVGKAIEYAVGALSQAERGEVLVSDRALERLASFYGESFVSVRRKYRVGRARYLAAQLRELVPGVKVRWPKKAE